MTATKTTSWLVIAALLASASPVAAAPKGKKAKVAFKRGVAAYQRGDFAAASEALAQSFKLEADAETLFAWAQSERQLDNCEKAIELYRQVLDFDMPEENKAAIREPLGECEAIVEAKKPPPPPPPEPPPPPPPPKRVQPPPRSRFDTIGVTLLGLGAVSLAAGGYFLASGAQADRDKLKLYQDFESLDARAESHGRIGVIAVAGGAVLLVGGVVRYALRGSPERRRAVISGWVAPGTGGIAAFGRF